MKSNREILSDIEIALRKRSLNDREKKQEELKLRQIEMDRIVHEIKMSLSIGAHQDRMRIINSGIVWYQ